MTKKSHLQGEDCQLFSLRKFKAYGTASVLLGTVSFAGQAVKADEFSGADLSLDAPQAVAEDPLETANTVSETNNFSLEMMTEVTSVTAPTMAIEIFDSLESEVTQNVVNAKETDVAFSLIDQHQALNNYKNSLYNSLPEAPVKPSGETMLNVYGGVNVGDHYWIHMHPNESYPTFIHTVKQEYDSTNYYGESLLKLGPLTKKGYVEEAIYNRIGIFPHSKYSVWNLGVGHGEVGGEEMRHHILAVVDESLIYTSDALSGTYAIGEPISESNTFTIFRDTENRYDYGIDGGIVKVTVTKPDGSSVTYSGIIPLME